MGRVAVRTDGNRRHADADVRHQPAPEGARPRLLGLLNAPVEWGGATWAAYVWDFVANETPRGRKELFLHECSTAYNRGLD